MDTVVSLDMYGKEYITKADELLLSVHVYGLAVRDGEILISPQWDGYDFPGGTAKLGETHLETLTREFKEETGYVVKPLRLLAIYTSFYHHHKSSRDYQSYLIFYQVEIVGGELSDHGFSEGEKAYAKLAKWVPLAELKQMRHVCSIDIADELIGKLEL